MDAITCPKCGTVNPADATNCTQCRINLQWALQNPTEVEGTGREQNAKLVSPDTPAYTGSHERPGCVTAYAVLLGAGAGLTAIVGIVNGLSMMGSRSTDGAAGLVTILVACVLAALYYLLARGLWQLKNWARIIVIVLQGLGILVGLVSLFSGNWLSLVGMAVGGYVLYWFAKHSEYFAS